jgi:beta-N-acetylhexosaminidase
MCTAKHFPGHGDTKVDSHLALPCVDKPLEELEKVDLIPFQAAVDAGVTAVMTAHILFPQIEPDNIPATMSRRIMQGILREKLGFRGIVVSDCMEMAAIREHYGVSEGTLAAFKAGVDLVEITHHPQWCADAAVRLLEAARAGELDMAEMDESVDRILSAKARWIEGRELGEFDFAAAAEESRLLMEQTITEVQRPAVPVELNHPLCIGCAPYRVSLVGNVDTREGNPFGDQMSRELGGICADMFRDPTAEEITVLVERAKKCGSAVVGTFNALANPGQLELIRALVENDIPTVAVALRGPYDLRNLPKAVWAIAAYEYSPESIRATAKVLRGELIPTGKLPVRM